MRVSLSNALKALPLGILLPMIFFMGSTPPEALTSNVSKWAKIVFGPHLPHWLIVPSADRWVMAGSIIVAFVYSGIAWRDSVTDAVHELEAKALGSHRKPVFVDMDVPSFVATFKEQTGLQAEGTAKLYNDKWIRFSGTIEDIRRRRYSSFHPWVIWGMFYEVGAFFSDENIPANKSTIFALLEFNREWKNHIEILRKGSRINAVGQISIFGTSMFLKNCKLV